MTRDISAADFPAIVAAKMIREAELGLHFNPRRRIDLAGYITKKDSPLVTLIETGHGNLTFVCPNCNRQNILPKQTIVVAICKFCKPSKSPD